jgi:hypothetical protein
MLALQQLPVGLPCRLVCSSLFRPREEIAPLQHKTASLAALNSPPHRILPVRGVQCFLPDVVLTGASYRGLVAKPLASLSRPAEIASDSVRAKSLFRMLRQAESTSVQCARSQAPFAAGTASSAPATLLSRFQLRLIVPALEAVRATRASGCLAEQRNRAGRTARALTPGLPLRRQGS